MLEIITGICLLLSAFFFFTAALGLFRLPDLYLRMHAASKAGTLGAGFSFLAIALISPDASVALRAIAGFTFLLLTAPVAAHLLARAAYLTGVPLWHASHIDDLEGKYVKGPSFLEGHPEP